MTDDKTFIVEFKKSIVELKKFEILLVMNPLIFEPIEPQSTSSTSIIGFAQSYLLLQSVRVSCTCSNATGIEPAIFCRLLLISGMIIIKNTPIISTNILIDIVIARGLLNFSFTGLTGSPFFERNILFSIALRGTFRKNVKQPAIINGTNICKSHNKNEPIMSRC